MERPREYLTAGLVAARNLLLGANLASLRMAARPRALVTYASENLFLLRALESSRGLVERHVFDVLPGSEEEGIVLARGEGESWTQPIGSYLVDLVSLCMICRRLQPETIFEIGTLQGFTALHLALNSPPHAQVYTLDLPRESAAPPALRTTLMDRAHIQGYRQRDAYAFTGTPSEPRIHPLFGDSATFDFAPWERRVDLFFIDGAHSYAYVERDTASALRCCRAGGVVAWHDFGRRGVNGVTRFLRRFAASGHEVYAVPGGSLAFMVVR